MNNDKPEKDIQADILAYLRTLGIRHTVTDAATNWKIHRRKTKRSWPDITGILLGGKALLIEVKTKTGGFKPGQEEMLDDLSSTGAEVIVARSVEDVAKRLAKYYGKCEV